MFLLGTFTTFGVWSNLPIAYALTSAAIIAGFLGLHWAHQASHALRRNPRLGGKAHARLGATLALVALLGSAYASGLLLLLIHPVAWTFWIALGIVLLPAHFGRKAGEISFLQALDPEAGTSQCGRCGDRVALGNGQWTEDRWVCLTCGSVPGV